MNNAIVLSPGEGKKYWLAGDHMTYKLTGAQTDSAYFAELSWVGPGEGVPPHLHHREDEMFYVLEGDVTFLYDHDSFIGGPGTAVYLKKGIPHAFANKTLDPIRFLIFTIPSGFENFVAECGTEIDRIPSGLEINPAMMETMMATAPKYGMEILKDHRPGGQSVPPRDRLFDVLGQKVRLKLDSAQTNGHFCVCEIGTPPASILPLHRHVAMDEIFYVVEGEYVFTIDGKQHAAPVGTFIYIPRGTPHRFQNVGKTPGRLADFHTPGGFEKFFEQCSGPVNHEKLPQMLASHGMELISID